MIHTLTIQVTPKEEADEQRLKSLIAENLRSLPTVLQEQKISNAPLITLPHDKNSNSR